MASEPTPGALLGELEAHLDRAGDLQVALQQSLREAEARGRTLSAEELAAFATLQAAVARIGRAQNGGGAGSIDALGTALADSERQVTVVRARLVELGATTPEDAGATPAPGNGAAPSPPEAATPASNGTAASPPAPATPRTFTLGQPRMAGADVQRFQHVLNQRYRAWGSGTRVAESGTYDPATRAAARAVALRLGVDPADLERGVTPALRSLIRTPSRRTAEQLARAKRRRRAAPAASAAKAGLAAAISAAGGRYEEAIIREAARAKLPVALVCAVIEQESSFRNVFGHDTVSNPVKSPPRGLLGVTRERYTQYLAHRKAGRGCQGVGPMQLTSSGLQDQADELGGCWRPGVNIRVGCDYLAGLMRAHGKKAGIQAYNGAPGFGYATSVLALEQKWRTRLMDVEPAGQARPRPHAPARPGGPRTFRLTAPKAMEGSDVKAFQRLLNARFDAWKIDIHVSEDGEYGPETRHAARQVARGLGIAPAGYAHGFTPHLRSLMRETSRRTPDQRRRAQANRAWRQRLRKHHAATGALRVRAYKEARRLRDMGVREVGGNNRGDMVAKIIRGNSGTGPEPWCGDFVAWCYRKAGSKSVNRRWASVRAYLPLAGLKPAKTPRQGDIVRFTFDHVGLFGGWCDSGGKAVAPGAATHLRTIEGNTGSSGAVSRCCRPLAGAVNAKWLHVRPEAL